jgi:hypothetical protein
VCVKVSAKPADTSPPACKISLSLWSQARERVGKEELRVQEHVEADLCKYVPKVGRADAFRDTASPQHLEDLVDPSLECGKE